MNHLSLKLGFWAAVGLVATFVIYTVCFVAILLTSPLFVWTNMADFIAHAEANGRFFPYLAQFSMLIFAVCFLLLLNSIHAGAPAEKRVLSRTGLSFGLLFTALSGLNYFVQISAVRFYVQAGQFTGLEQFLLANPHSAISAVNMLGVTLFFGLSSLFIAPVFSGKGRQKVIRLAFYGNGVFMLVAFVSFLFQWLIPLFLTVYIGMGAAILVASVALVLHFRQMERDMKERGERETAVSFE